MCGEMAVLRDQWPQYRHQLGSGHVLYGDDPRHDVIRAPAAAAFEFGTGHLPGVGIRQDLDDIAGRYRDEAIDGKYRQKGFVECIRTHRRHRQHGDLRLDPGIENEVLAGDLADRLDNLADIGILVVRGDGRAGFCAQRSSAGQAEKQRTGQLGTGTAGR